MRPKTLTSDLLALEFNRILDEIADRTLSPSSRAYILNLPFLTDPDLLDHELSCLAEFKGLLEFDDPFPIETFPDFYPIIRQAEIEGSVLAPEHFLGIRQFISMTGRLFHYFWDRKEKYPLLFQIMAKCTPLPELEKSIDRIIDPAGQIRDAASETLRRIRKDMLNHSEKIRSKLEALLRQMVDKAYAQESQLVLREGRLVIPMKQNQAAHLKGLVLDQSASGATVFVEPFAVADLNNSLRRLRLDEEKEIRRILSDLTNQFRIQLDVFRINLTQCVRMDSLHARTRFAVETRSHRALPGNADEITLNHARHPLLLLKMKREQVIPLTVKMDSQIRTLVLSGPNAGGKTVAAKTIGLLALMNQHGMLIPADEDSTLPLFSGIYADVGDRQSIEQDLSTFSSHISNIKRILDRVDLKSLVILDEIGSSTDPAEGVALAIAVLRHLLRKGATTVVTTHLGELKVFAHNEPGVENGSMLFNQDTLSPTYRFQLGLPGSSYAFEIAERLGVSANIIREARSRIGESRNRLDQLVLDLEKELEKTRSRLHEVEIQESRLSGLVRLYQDKIDRIKQESEKRQKALLAEADEILRQANVTAEQVIREIREEKASRAVIRTGQKKIRSQREKINKLQKTENALPPALKPGDRVRWTITNATGEVISNPDKSGRIHILSEGIKLKVPAAELEIAEGSPPSKTMTGKASYPSAPSVSSEIDLRGLTAEEAIQQTDQFIGEAAVAGLSFLRIIHGKGTGVLRKEVGQFLEHHPLIKAQRPGRYNEGDAGVTVVEIK